MNAAPAQLALPAPSAVPARSPLPIFAALVPIAGGVVLWLVTGSAMALWFAALGPLIAVAALVDQVRGGRRRRRREAVERALAFDVLEEAVTLRLDGARQDLVREHPDVLELARDPSCVWRGGSELVLGSGPRASGIEITGAAAGDERALAVRERAATVADAPVTFPWRGGVCVVGDGPQAAAVLRSLLLQLCMTHPPTALRIVGDVPDGWDWIERMPHRHSRSVGAVRVAARIGDPATADADTVFALAATGSPPDPRCATIVSLDDGGGARAVGPGSRSGGADTVDQVEAVAASQASLVASVLAVRARAVYQGAGASSTFVFDDLRAIEGRGADGGLAVSFAVDGRGPRRVDLVSDGPHAIVVGVTGSGKSELLRSWITALCDAYPTSKLAFLLADFKGGTAFDALTDLRHVTGVITDLDAEGARRAISSLRAEIRRREHALAAAGARDVDAPGVDLPRLVIVVDEYAALVSEHAELAAVFTDVAARGRALGMHLILGTQRATGVIRDAVLANCPLRICLRVADPADSRLVIGTEAATALSGSPEDRGRALVRGAADREAFEVRVVQATTEDVATVASGRATERRPRTPWLPPLPVSLSIQDVPCDEPDRGPRAILGLIDDPDRQRRIAWTLDPARDRGLLVVGGAGSGRTGVLDVIAAQVPVVRVGDDPEAAWDALDRARASSQTVLIDDVDGLLASVPDEYASAMAGTIERMLREPHRTVVATARRIVGPLGRIADLFPHRAVLDQPSRAEFAAAGGDPGFHDSTTVPGRAFVAGRRAQVIHVASTHAAEVPTTAPEWTARGDAAIVTRAPSRVIDALRSRGVPVRALVDAGGARTWDEYAVTPAFDEGDRGVVVVGEPGAWQQRWGLLVEARDRHEVIVDAACAAELRMLTGERDLPPYCVPHTDRAWLVRSGERPTRVRMPGPAAAW